jgi:ABC-type uncharacterized transport system substrate-binding protein
VGQDPVAMGLVASLAHPGGNVTGINYFSLEVNAKRLALMHELLPKAARFAVLVNPGNATSAEVAAKALKEAAPALGLEILFLNASTPLSSMRPSRLLRANVRMPFLSRPMASSTAAACRLRRWRYATG